MECMALSCLAFAKKKKKQLMTKHNCFVTEHDLCIDIWDREKLLELPVAFFSCQSLPVWVEEKQKEDLLRVITSDIHINDREPLNQSNVQYVIITRACLRLTFSSLNWFSSASSSTVYACKSN